MLKLEIRIKQFICREFSCQIIYFRCKSLCNRSAPKYLELGSCRKKRSSPCKTCAICQACSFPWELFRAIPFVFNLLDVIYFSHQFEHFYDSSVATISGDKDEMTSVPHYLQKMCNVNWLKPDFDLVTSTSI